MDPFVIGLGGLKNQSFKDISITAIFWLLSATLLPDESVPPDGSTVPPPPVPPDGSVPPPDPPPPPELGNTSAGSYISGE